MSDLVTTIDQLEAIYGEANHKSLIKELDRITDEYRRWIEACPFLILSTVGPEGTDCTPRGDPPGFVRVIDDRTVAMPDRRGNNRIDNLRNIVRDPRVSLLFMIPGIGETVRINGKGRISVDPDLLASFEMQGKAPRSVLLVEVETIYFQCQKALARSRLWSADAQIRKGDVPTAGDFIKAVDDTFDGATYDATYPEHMKTTIY